MIAHFTGSDGPSTLLALGLGFVLLGGRRVLRGERGWQARGVRWLVLGAACLVAGVVVGLR
ncbi:MAG TPA: hypothetical protein VGO92_00995 [Acidimicrobiales bacterium]|nr:hypothetical protein [Acidimicrobiales bacterium]